ncbi:MAG TPA: DUF2911 domain-containing protein [Longimicrobiales bacterium]
MRSRFRIVLAFSAALAVVSCARESTETWGFVATLGNDTTSVERITRAGDRIVSEAVGRSPLVVRRRWQATLGPDGSLRNWSMDTHVPNAPSGESDLHHEVEWGEGTIRLVRHAGSDTTDRTFVDAYARTVPWNAFVYGTFELLFQAARGLPDSTRIGQYFFEGWSEGNLGFARVRRLGDGLVALTSTGLSGSGVARIDDQGRMLSYSGEGTTYRQEVRRTRDVPDIDAIVERFAADERAQGVSRLLSARDTVRAAIGTATITIDYGRPLARGRTLLGGLIPYDRVWRTGANAATHLTIATSLRLGGVPLDSGTYTLWTLPLHDGVQLIINRQTGQWGTGYQSSHDIARVAMSVDTLDSPIERFTIRVDTAGSRLVMEWGTFRWSAPIE